jgi:hypothetical protein
LLNPPASCGIDPEGVFPVLGSRDALVPPHTLTATLDAWDVPPANRTAWETGHFGVLLRAIRGDLEGIIGAALAFADDAADATGADTAASRSDDAHGRATPK